MLAFMEVVTVLLALLFVVTQILIPVWRRKTLFPFFSKQAQLESELVHLHGENEVVDLERIIKEEREALEKKREALKKKFEPTQEQK